MIPNAATHLTDGIVITRLVLATLASAFVGIEREYHEKPAGLRTNVMVGIGACLFTMLSIRIADLYPEFKSVDPARIAANVVVGIGFLGAGTILFEKDRTNVRGLTTAATLWVVAAVGMAIGLGLYVEAFSVLALIFFTFLVLSRVVSAVRVKRQYAHHDDHSEEEE